MSDYSKHLNVHIYEIRHIECTNNLELIREIIYLHINLSPSINK